MRANGTATRLQDTGHTKRTRSDPGEKNVVKNEKLCLALKIN